MQKYHEVPWDPYFMEKNAKIIEIVLVLVQSHGLDGIRGAWELLQWNF